jgi:palmitoyltransferase
MIISSGIATFCDPTDRVVYHYKWSRHDKKISFAPDYTKVLYCEYCDSYCMADSKHCRACNRCVKSFDHHCIWLNNCVGERNYNYFMVSIVSAFAYTVVVVIHVILESFSIDFRDKTELAKIILSWILGGVLGIFGFLLFNLIVLHIYLIMTEQTTYTFLQRKKKE